MEPTDGLDRCPGLRCRHVNELGVGTASVACLEDPLGAGFVTVDVRAGRDRNPVVAHLRRADSVLAAGPGKYSVAHVHYFYSADPAPLEMTDVRRQPSPSLRRRGDWSPVLRVTDCRGRWLRRRPRSAMPGCRGTTPRRVRAPAPAPSAGPFSGWA